MIRNPAVGDNMYPNHEHGFQRGATPVVCVYEMGANDDLFRTIAREYELNELDLAYACLSMAIDRMYGCGTDAIEFRVRQWLEADDRSEFSQRSDTLGLFAGLVTNMSYLADIIHGVLRKTIDPTKYESVRADRVVIESGTLYLVLNVLESLV